jgi:hypothetical protein
VEEGESKFLVCCFLNSLVDLPLGDCEVVSGTAVHQQPMCTDLSFDLWLILQSS